ncbi:MAG: class I SAM-dependent methyltransferase [Candidatus Udaeobacter sp.]
MSTDTITGHSPQFDVDLREIRKHYDRLSIFYRLLWGEHLHHGYWENGESIERAQIKLMEKLAQTATIPRGATVLDIGCGLGGSAFWLAEQYNCRVTGLTISPVQARMATNRARAKRLNERVRFVVGDANVWEPQAESADAIWIMESSEHFRDKPNFFERCALALKPSGMLAVCAWLRGKESTAPDRRKLVEAIGRAMLSASLDTLDQYVDWMRRAGLSVQTAEDITAKIAPTWEYCTRMAERWPMRWLIPFTDAPTRRFVKSFPLMSEAYASGAMAFGLFVARKATA